MESEFVLIPFLFLFMLLLFVAALIVSIVLFLQIRKIAFEVKTIKDELSFQSENSIEEASSFERMIYEFNVMSKDIVKSIECIQVSVNDKIDAKIAEMGISKKTYDEQRWGSLKEAFKPQQQRPNDERV